MEISVGNLETDYETTDKNIIRHLEERMTLISYNDAYDICAATNGNQLSAKTNPVEKLRQRYGERKPHESISFHNGGWLGLRRWFEPKQRKLINPLFPVDESYSIIESDILGRADAGWNIGYEYAKREPYMYDHFNNRNTQRWQDRVMTGYLVERHVSDDFRSRYPEFWMPPDNEGDYKRPCDHDFKLKIMVNRKSGTGDLLIDAKSWSVNNGKRTCPVRNAKPNHAYVVGGYNPDKNKIEVSGFFFGSSVNGDGLQHVTPNTIFHIEILHVIMMMQRMVIEEEYGLTWYEARDKIKL